MRTKYPLSLTAFGSSPKGTPFGAAEKFPATTKAVPLGKVAANAVSRRKGFACRPPGLFVSNRLAYLLKNNGKI